MVEAEASKIYGDNYMKSDYDIIEIKKDNINLIKDLWEKNRIFHQNKTSNFSYQYSNLDFDERMNNIFNSKNIKYYKISAIINKSNIVGYCLSIIQGSSGELCTLFVDEQHRNNGLGHLLVDKHLDWLKDNKCESIFVNVLVENESTIRFYESLGFKQNIINMEIPLKKI